MSHRFTEQRLYRWPILFGIITIGLAVRWPALGATMMVDDWDHYAMQQGIYPVRVRPVDMFNFVPGEDAARRALLETGRIPWFSSPNIQLSVLRPLSSVLAYVDYAWLDGHHHPWRLHLHSLIWWIFLLVGIAAVLMESLPFPAAATGLLLCALDDAHTWPVTWTANRSQIISVALVMWAVWAEITARKSGRRLRALAGILAALGLCAGEHALPALGYLAAYELLGNSESLRRRLFNLLPWALLASIYLAVHAALGYGTSGSGFYINPVTDPSRFLSAFSVRLPKLLAELTFGIPADWWSLWPAWELAASAHRYFAWNALQVQWYLGVLGGALALTACAWFGSNRAQRIGERRELCWLCGGALLSLAPLGGAETMSRLTLAPGIGFLASFGWAVWALTRRALCTRSYSLRVGAAACVAMILYVHVAYAGLRSYWEGRLFAQAWPPQQAAQRLGEFGDQPLTGRHVIIIDSPDATAQHSLMYVRHFAGRSVPVSSEILSPAISNSHILERVAPNVLDIRFPKDLIGRPFLHSVYRSEEHPFRAGQLLRCARFDVGVLATSQGEPTHLRFVFPVALDDPRYLFMAHERDRLVPLALPRLGERRELPAVSPWR